LPRRSSEARSSLTLPTYSISSKPLSSSALTLED
jgi:hypothetical protein